MALNAAAAGARSLFLEVASDNDEDIALLAVQAPSEDALRSIFAADPWAVHQVFRITDVRVWTFWLDGRSRQVPTAAAT